MKYESRELARLMRAAALSAGVAAIALLPISVQAQTTESAAYAVAKNSQSTEGTLKFIEAYPQSPLGLELVQALPEDLQKDVCVSLPESLPIDDALIQYCATLLNILPAAGPTTTYGGDNGGGDDDDDDDGGN
jgi:hypothetical protein